MSNNTKFKMEVPSLPEVPKTISMYKTSKPTVEDQKKQIKSLSEFIGMKRGMKSVSETPEELSVMEEDRVLECYKESGSIWYGDMSKLWQETPESIDYEKAFGVKGEPGIEKKVESMAKDVLEKSGLLPKEAYFIGTAKSEFAELKKGEEDTGETSVSGITALYGFKLDNIPVVGPGAKIRVDYGSDGKMVGLFKAWREGETDKNLPVVPPEEALEKFQTSRLFADLDEDSKVSVKNFYLAHYALPAFEPQDYLLPVYVLEGEVETPHLTHEFIRYVPAVSLEELKNEGMLADPGVFPDPDLL